MNKTTVTFGLLAMSAVGCRVSPTAQAPVPRHLAVVCDASDSGAGVTCTPAALSRAVRAWSLDAVSRPGSRMVIVQTGRARDDAAVIAHAEVPPSWGPGARARKAAWTRALLAALPAELAARPGSAVLEAIHVALGAIPRDGERSLRVLSDLREVSADGGWNFERRVPRADRFRAWISRVGLTLDLRDATVDVCGMHHQRAARGPRFGARAEQEIRAMWEGIFRDAGSRAVRIEARCDEDARAVVLR